jgi:two-component system cell cycle sensor histidine kinase/response regulator CckA
MKRVLVVEDDCILGGLLAGVLSSHGYEVLLANDGWQAVEICSGSEKPIEALVCDIVIPGLGPSDVIRAAVGLHPGMRVLVMTGGPDLDVVEPDILSRVCVLRKPFSLAEFAASVKAAVDANTLGHGKPESMVDAAPGQRKIA